MANFLASIFGTEQDKVNCSFYFKIGACRHGERCSRKHVKPSYSQTILIPNLYQNPSREPRKNQPVSHSGNGSALNFIHNGMSEAQVQTHFDAFYEDIYCELAQYGRLEELVICDNTNDHLMGNVYARFQYEDAAQRACDALNTRWFAGKPVYCELSPVTDFREACCRLNAGEGGCVRGGVCNFIHRKMPTPAWERELELSAQKHWQLQDAKDRATRRAKRERTRSPTPDRRRY